MCSVSDFWKGVREFFINHSRHHVAFEIGYLIIYLMQREWIYNWISFKKKFLLILADYLSSSISWRSPKRPLSFRDLRRFESLKSLNAKLSAENKSNFSIALLRPVLLALAAAFRVLNNFLEVCKHFKFWIVWTKRVLKHTDLPNSENWNDAILAA